MAEIYSSLPLELELTPSDSSCDVSVLSLSSYSSLGSISISKDRRKSKRCLRKSRHSQVKFNPYKANGRWHNPVDEFGSASMSNAPFRRASSSRLSNSALDIAVNAPARRISRKTLLDTPVSVPTRQQSSGRALYSYESSLETKNKNFEWSKSIDIAPAQEFPFRTPSPLVEGRLGTSPPRLAFDMTMTTKIPPALPLRKGSIMDFEMLGTAESTRVETLVPVNFEGNTKRLPRIPARKPSLADLVEDDDCSSLPPASNANNNWDAKNHAMDGSSGSNNSSRRSIRRISDYSAAAPKVVCTATANVFLAVPPVTCFERRVSSEQQQQTKPRRHTSCTLKHHKPLIRLNISHHRALSMTGTMRAPSYPTRKESMMDLNA